MKIEDFAKKFYSLCFRIDRCAKMIKQGFVSLVSDDSSAYPQVQVTYNGKPVQAVRLSPYGLFGNAPEGSMAVLLSPNAQESRQFVILDDMRRRKKSIKGGECGLYNVLTRKYIYLREDGVTEAIADAFHLNGDEFNLVMWQQLNDVLSSLESTFNNHTHNSGPTPDQSVNLDIDDAKAETLKTDG